MRRSIRVRSVSFEDITLSIYFKIISHFYDELTNTGTDENLVLYLQEEIKQLRYQLQKLMSKRRDHRLDEENARLREAVRGVKSYPSNDTNQTLYHSLEHTHRYRKERN